jgi:hypothetical protein
MSKISHFEAAEELLAAGRKVIDDLKAVGFEHGPLTNQRRDDLGKQAMGIWAQAQVHATLALAEAQRDAMKLRGYEMRRT